MALTGNHDLQLWPLERGKKYILLVTPVEIVEQEQGGAALGGGIRSVSGGTFNQDDMRIEHIGEETIRVDFEIPADYESDEERLMGHPDVYRTVFRLPDIELKQVKK